MNGPAVGSRCESGAAPPLSEVRRLAAQSSVASTGQIGSSTSHWRSALGRESRSASSQETGPFVPACKSLEGGARGRTPDRRAFRFARSCRHSAPVPSLITSQDGFCVFRHRFDDDRSRSPRCVLRHARRVAVAIACATRRDARRAARATAPADRRHRRRRLTVHLADAGAARRLAHSERDGDADRDRRDESDRRPHALRRRSGSRDAAVGRRRRRSERRSDRHSPSRSRRSRGRATSATRFAREAHRRSAFRCSSCARRTRPTSSTASRSIGTADRPRFRGDRASRRRCARRSTACARPSRGRPAPSVFYVVYNDPPMTAGPQHVHRPADLARRRTIDLRRRDAELAERRDGRDRAPRSRHAHRAGWRIQRQLARSFSRDGRMARPARGSHRTRRHRVRGSDEPPEPEHRARRRACCARDPSRGRRRRFVEEPAERVGDAFARASPGRCRCGSSCSPVIAVVALFAAVRLGAVSMTHERAVRRDRRSRRSDDDHDRSRAALAARAAGGARRRGARRERRDVPGAAAQSARRAVHPRRVERRGGGRGVHRRDGLVACASSGRCRSRRSPAPSLSMLLVFRIAFSVGRTLDTRVLLLAGVVVSAFLVAVDLARAHVRRHRVGSLGDLLDDGQPRQRVVAQRRDSRRLSRAGAARFSSRWRARSTCSRSANRRPRISARRSNARSSSRSARRRCSPRRRCR